jgi:hypothetical protein
MANKNPQRELRADTITGQVLWSSNFNTPRGQQAGYAEKLQLILDAAPAISPATLDQIRSLLTLGSR